MSFAAVYNTTGSPVVIDPAGRTLEGLQWAAVDTTVPAVSSALEEGRLVTVALPKDHPVERRRRALADQAGRLSAHDVKDLRALAAEHPELMPGELESLTKPQLVVALAVADLEPSAQPAPVKES